MAAKKSSKKKTRKLVTKRVSHELRGMQFRIKPSARRYMHKRLEEFGPFPLQVFREDTNPEDENALKVTIDERGNPYDGFHIGYVAREAAAVYSPKLDKGEMRIAEAWLHGFDVEAGTGVIRLKLKVSLSMRQKKSAQPSRKPRT